MPEPFIVPTYAHNNPVHKAIIPSDITANAINPVRKGTFCVDLAGLSSSFFGQQQQHFIQRQAKQQIFERGPFNPRYATFAHAAKSLCVYTAISDEHKKKNWKGVSPASH